MRVKLLLVLIFSMLTGCSARLVSADENDVVISNVSKHTAGDAERIAEKVCAQFNKQAFKMSIDESAGIANYKCVQPY